MSGAALDAVLRRVLAAFARELALHPTKLAMQSQQRAAFPKELR